MSQGFAPRREVLGNGLTLIHQHNPASPAVVASLSFAGGAMGEPADKAGVTTLMAAALRRGTEKRTKQDIGEILDFRGAHLRCSASRHSASLVAKMRGADAPALFELMADCARHPSFPEEEVEQLRGNRITSLREDEDDPDVMANRGFRELLFPADHPYSAAVRGSVETIDNVTRGDLAAVHAARFDPSAALLVVVGDIAWDSAAELAAAHLGDWQGAALGGYRAAQVQVVDAPMTPPSERWHDMPDKAQVSLLMGHAGIRRDDVRFYAAALMNSVLGRFAMGGRLGRVVREEQGMAYYTYSGFAAGWGAGPFSVQAGVQPEHLDAAIASIREQIARTRETGVEASELDDARAAAVGSLPRTLESNEGMAGLLHQIELFDLGWDYPSRYSEVMAAVDLDAANAAALDLLHPEEMVLSAAGPVGDRSAN
ncbi:MAG: hypothetical protein GKS06_07320 [Acidobacteria bacterium]|nr:hypothetical protein [Acidobacteriota bacterium]